MWAPAGASLWTTLSGFYHWGNADVRRGYINAGVPDISLGQTDTRTRGVSMRLDWENAAKIGSIALTPYAKLTRLRTDLGAYTERGGGFPAAFDARRENATEGRVSAC
jgi:uncharacterized protein with beta-barrel porin domain